MSVFALRFCASKKSVRVLGLSKTCRRHKSLPEPVRQYCTLYRRHQTRGPCHTCLQTRGRRYPKLLKQSSPVMVLNKNATALLGICILLAACAPAAVQAKRQLLTPGTCSCTTILPPGPVCDVFCGKAFPTPGHHGHSSGCSCKATCNSEMYECTKDGFNSGCSCFCDGGQPQILGGGECHRVY